MKPKTNQELIDEARGYAQMTVSLLGVLATRLAHGVDFQNGKFTQMEVKQEEQHD